MSDPMEIPLTQGKVALVSPEDYERVMADGTWFLGHKYAKRGTGESGKFLHQFITSAPEGVEVDHIDGNTLNNQRENLRFATRSQNAANAPGWSKKESSDFKGVFPNGKTGWMAKAKFNHQNHYLGTFKSEEDAAKAYDSKAIEFWGEFAWTNFLEDGTRRFREKTEDTERTEPIETNRPFKPRRGADNTYVGVYKTREARLDAPRSWQLQCNEVFAASITYYGKQIHLGSFNTEKEAALAYDEKSRELFGEGVRTNFSKEEYSSNPPVRRPEIPERPPRLPEHEGTGHPGVYRKWGSFYSRVKHDGHIYHCGTYKTLEEAIRAREVKRGEILGR